MEIQKKQLRYLRKKLKLGDFIEYRGNRISLKTPFKRISFRDLLLESIGIDINVEDNFDKFKAAMKDKKIDVDISGCKHYGSLLDEVYRE